MPLQYSDPETNSGDVVEALRRDGAAVVRNQVNPEIVHAVLAQFRTPFDEVGKFDESDFNGYKTLRVSGVLAVSPASADLVAHPRVMEVADEILLAHCINYRIGSLTAIEIYPCSTSTATLRPLGAWPPNTPFRHQPVLRYKYSTDSRRSHKPKLAPTTQKHVPHPGPAAEFWFRKRSYC